MSRMGRAAVLAATALLLLTACQAEDEPETSEAEEPETQEPGTDAAAVTITGVDYAFEGVPDSLDVGAELSFTNASEEEMHELVLIRLPDDEERPVSELVTLPEEEIGPLMAGLVGVSVAPPGAEGMVVEGDLTLTEAGRYALLCFVPTGADPEEFMETAQEAEGGPPEVEGGPPHVANGMFSELTVE